MALTASGIAVEELPAHKNMGDSAGLSPKSQGGKPAVFLSPGASRGGIRAGSAPSSPKGRPQSKASI